MQNRFLIKCIGLMLGGSLLIYLGSSCGDIRPPHKQKVAVNSTPPSGTLQCEAGEHFDQERGGCVCDDPQKEGVDLHCIPTPTNSEDAGPNVYVDGGESTNEDAGYTEDGGVVVADAGDYLDAGAPPEVDGGVDAGVQEFDAGVDLDAGLDDSGYMCDAGGAIDAGDDQMDGGDDEEEVDSGWCRLKHHHLPPKSQGNNYGWYKCHKPHDIDHNDDKDSEE